MNAIAKPLSALAAVVLTACASAPTAPTAPSTQIPVTFHKEKVYEIAFSSVKDGKLGQLMNDYFAKVMPLAAEHGGRLAATFRLEPPVPAAIPAQMGAFFEWPSVDAFLRATQDARIGVLFPVRNDALSYVNEANFFTVDHDSTVNFDSNRGYEIVGVSAATAEEQRSKSGTLLVLRSTQPAIGTFRPEAVLVVDREASASAAVLERNTSLRIRFNTLAR